MPAPATPDDVVAFLAPETTEATTRITELAAAHLPIVTEMIKAYVRGNGFDELDNMNTDIRAVIISSTARLAQNPEGLVSKDMQIDDFKGAQRFSVFDGWTLPELAILHRYRKRAM